MKLVEAESKKKKGGKGLSVLSGRALYEYNKKLFVDDAAAVADIAETANELNGAAEDISSSLPPPPPVGKQEQDASAAMSSIAIDDNVFLEGDDDDLDDIEDDD